MSGQEILERFTGLRGDSRPLFLPDLTLWHKWHSRRSTMPADWVGFSLPEVARGLGTAAWTIVRPWQMTTPGIEVQVVESATERAITYTAPAGVLSERWSLGPDGDWWQVEYPVKGFDDLAIARQIVAARTYTVDAAALAGLGAAEEVVAAIEIPMRPYSDLLHTVLGWGEGLLLLRGAGRPAVEEMLLTLEEKLQRLVEAVAQMPGTLVLAPDNLDGQYVSPRIFGNYLAGSYAATAETLHRQGKRLVVHAGGTVKKLLPLLAECGVDGVEGIAGPPQSDANLREAREAAGPDLTLWGGIAQDFLLDIHSQDEFEAAVREAAQQAAGDGRILIGVADRVPVDADVERLRAIPRLVQEVRTRG